MARLRPLNDTVILEPDQDRWFFVENPEIERILREGKLALPDLNTLVKINPWGRVVSFGKRCSYSLREGQRVYVPYRDKTQAFKWYEVNDKKYRLVMESEIDLVEE